MSRNVVQQGTAAPSRRVWRRWWAAFLSPVRSISRMFEWLVGPLGRNAVAEASDFGRRFGWFIERDGVRIGELEYVRWDDASQFWHEYRVIWRQSEDAVVGPDAWMAARLVLRNRRCTDVVVDRFLTADYGDGRIAVRGASVPVERCAREEMGQPGGFGTVGD